MCDSAGDTPSIAEFLDRSRGPRADRRVDAAASAAHIGTMKGERAKLAENRKGTGSDARMWRAIEGDGQGVSAAERDAAFRKYQSAAMAVVRQCEAELARLIRGGSGWVIIDGEGNIAGSSKQQDETVDLLAAGPQFDFDNHAATIGVWARGADVKKSDVEKLSNVQRVYDGPEAAAWFNRRGSFISDEPFPNSPFLVIVLAVPQNGDRLNLPADLIYTSVVAKEGVGYTTAVPPSEAAVTPPLRMRDDFNIAAKEAKGERTAAGRLANYQFLARTVDLENPALVLAEQRRRAYLLLTAYERVQQVKQDFKDSNAQLTAARRIKQAARRERQRAKRPPAPRGRPRKVAQP